MSMIFQVSVSPIIIIHCTHFSEAKIKVGDGVEIDYGLVSNANFSKKGRIVTDHRVRS